MATDVWGKTASFSAAPFDGDRGDLMPTPLTTTPAVEDDAHALHVRDVCRQHAPQVRSMA